MPKQFITLEGSDELLRQLAGVEPKAAKGALRRAVRAGMKTIHAEAQKLCPIDTGLLERSIKVRSGKKRGVISMLVQTKDGFFKGQTFYGAFVELGTERIPAQPFLRPAFDRKKGEALEKIQTELSAALGNL